MIMGKVIIAGGGGSGVSSDECTATKAEVLKGYSAITADSDDGVVEGTLELTGDVSDSQVLEGKTYYNTNPKIKKKGSMVNHGAVSISLNADASYTVPAGFHNGGGKVAANSLVSQTSATATSAKILSGQTAWANGSKVTGTIPIQGADVSGTDRAWATGMSNWAGTINLGIRNGHYLNGVNWIQANIPEYQPWNIKKGVNIGGIVGTFEGYVPTANDLYVRGNNIAGFTSTDRTNFSFETGQINYSGVGIGSWGSHASMSVDNINLTGKSYLNIQFALTKTDNSGENFNLAIVKPGATLYNSQLGLVSHPANTYVVDKVMSIPLSQIQMVVKIGIYFYTKPGTSFDGAIQRIWLS